MSKYAVFLVHTAEQDLLNLYKYVALYDAPEKANALIDKIESLCEKLKDFPERGHCPPKLLRIGIKDFLEIHFKPYRIIYRIFDKNVYIYCILDGRRNMQTLLEQRLLQI